MDQLRSNTRFAFILMGIVSILFGLCAVIFTPDTVDVLYTFLAAFWIVSGLFGIFAGISGAAEHRWLAFFMGLLGVIAGVVALRMPLTTIVVLMVLLGFWALADGISQLFGSFDLKGAGVDGWYWTALDGVLTALLGVLMLIAPFDTLGSLVWVLGIWALLRGVLLVMSGLALPKN